MKNKGMHQQPHAYQPSTGGTPAQTGFNKGAPAAHSHSAPPSWKPVQKPSSPETKGFQKPHKKAA